MSKNTKEIINTISAWIRDIFDIYPTNNPAKDLKVLQERLNLLQEHVAPSLSVKIVPINNGARLIISGHMFDYKLKGKEGRQAINTILHRIKASASYLAADIYEQFKDGALLRRPYESIEELYSILSKVVGGEAIEPPRARTAPYDSFVLYSRSTESSEQHDDSTLRLYLENWVADLFTNAQTYVKPRRTPEQSLFIVVDSLSWFLVAATRGISEVHATIKSYLDPHQEKSVEDMLDFVLSQLNTVVDEIINNVWFRDSYTGKFSVDFFNKLGANYGFPPLEIPQDIAYEWALDKSNTAHLESNDKDVALETQDVTTVASCKAAIRNWIEELIHVNTAVPGTRLDGLLKVAKYLLSLLFLSTKVTHKNVEELYLRIPFFVDGIYDTYFAGNERHIDFEVILNDTLQTSNDLIIPQLALNIQSEDTSWVNEAFVPGNSVLSKFTKEQLATELKFWLDELLEVNLTNSKNINYTYIDFAEMLTYIMAGGSQYDSAVALSGAESIYSTKATIQEKKEEIDKFSEKSIGYIIRRLNLIGALDAVGEEEEEDPTIRDASILQIFNKVNKQYADHWGLDYIPFNPGHLDDTSWVNESVQAAKIISDIDNIKSWIVAMLEAAVDAQPTEELQMKALRVTLDYIQHYIKGSVWYLRLNETSIENMWASALVHVDTMANDLILIFKMYSYDETDGALINKELQVLKDKKEAYRKFVVPVEFETKTSVNVSWINETQP